jgi:hypothetical protein
MQLFQGICLLALTMVVLCRVAAFAAVALCTLAFSLSGLITRNTRNRPANDWFRVTVQVPR